MWGDGAEWGQVVSDLGDKRIISSVARDVEGIFDFSLVCSFDAMCPIGPGRAVLSIASISMTSGLSWLRIG